jgi:DNA-binding NarL/FixJ family response regulator
MTDDEPSPITVVLIDPDDIAREGLARLLDGAPRFTVLRAVRTVRDARLERLRPMLIICDPEADGRLHVECIRELRAAAPLSYICTFTSPLERQLVIDAIGAGARMYLLKGKHSSGDVLGALTFLARTGMIMVDPEIAIRFWESGERVVLQRPSPAAMRLTGRELEVLRLYAHDLRVKEIARRFHIDHRTVSAHLASARRKLGAGTNAELVRLATEQGLLAP